MIGLIRADLLHTCFCGKPDRYSHWIECDNGSSCKHPYANGWFHTACVDITEEDAHQMEYNGTEWYCSWCGN